ncbi:hypothetical protein [Fulvivirga lutea]|uniref:Uncharacterized protein n=1 Tax=Fulvivirga lutea TaxID=2810512 RepID=A0A974WH16_9BACT|nr:hypothetical protein [Fulvivirga lutea]QSE97072.1 hypothetical protein JR347_15980 [Fulvivirga lutea]
MKRIILLITLSSTLSYSQNFDYVVNDKNPYGLINPAAPKQTADYAELIGKSACKSVSRIDQNTWADTVQMTWIFKYIMNGMAVQDETYKDDNVHSGSIRQYNYDSTRWYVHYYTTGRAVPTLPAWEGNREGNQIILYRDQKSPNGFEGDYRITFSDISEDSFNWVGEWVSKNRLIVYPTWRIYCIKEE